jgi:hypothetical protein
MRMHDRCCRGLQNRIGNRSALDVGALNSILTNNTLGGGAYNSKFDLFDANTNCDNNQWFADDATATASQTCIK